MLIAFLLFFLGRGLGEGLSHSETKQESDSTLPTSDELNDEKTASGDVVVQDNTEDEKVADSDALAEDDTKKEVLGLEQD